MLWAPIIKHASCGMRAHSWTHILWCEWQFLNAHVAWVPIIKCASCCVSAHDWICIWHECPLLNAHLVAWVPILEWACGVTRIYEHAFLSLARTTPLYVMCDATFVTSFWQERHFFLAWPTRSCGIRGTFSKKLLLCLFPLLAFSFSCVLLCCFMLILH